MATITAANSVFLLSVAGVYDVPQQLQGYATDDAFATESVQIVETMMGIDGILSAGFVHAPRSISVTLQADSPSNALFDNWAAAMEAAREVYAGNATISLPGPGLTYALRKGFLTQYTPISDVRKVLQPRKYTVVFQTVLATPTV